MIEKFLLISKEILKGFIFLVLKIFNTEQSNILDIDNALKFLGNYFVTIRCCNNCC